MFIGPIAAVARVLYINICLINVDLLWLLRLLSMALLAKVAGLARVLFIHKLLLLIIEYSLWKSHNFLFVFATSV